MKNYARVENGTVIEIILGAPYEAPPAELQASIDPEVWQILVDRVGTEIPITERFTPDFVAELIEITGIDPAPESGWTYDGSTFHQPTTSPADIVALAATARLQRDQLLRDNYDRGILMLQRMVRMTTDDERLIYLNGKIAELDNYATELQEIPEQPGFPLNIVWPTVPSE